MDRKNIERELSSIEEEILEHLEYNLENFIIAARNIPDFLSFKVTLNDLCNLHVKITILLEYIRALIELEDRSYDKVVYKGVLLKSHIDALVKSHSEFSKKKYPRNFEYRLKEEKGTNCIQLNSKNLSHNYLKFIKGLIGLVVQKGKIENSKPQREAFVSLFYPFKAEDKLKWNGQLYTLKRFFDQLEELEMISKPAYLNMILSQKCLIKDKSGNFIHFDPVSYKTSKGKAGYNTQFDEWIEIKSFM